MKWVDSCYLLGAALEWAVAKCEDKLWMIGEWSAVSSLGRSIIEREKISVIHVEEDDPYTIEDGPWVASVKDLDYGVSGPTALIAAMRCYVCWKLGATIEIPDELVNGG